VGQPQGAEGGGGYLLGATWLVNPLAITARAVLIGCFRAMYPAVN
jgi:hypothetical protein